MGKASGWGRKSSALLSGPLISFLAPLIYPCVNIHQAVCTLSPLLLHSFNNNSALPATTVTEQTGTYFFNIAAFQKLK